MIAWRPALRTAVKLAPVALELARQVDRQVRPHLLAYRLARSVDGYVGLWEASSGTHWLVFRDREAKALQAFPPLPPDELASAASQLDRGQLRHHDELPEARAREAAAGVKRVPAKAVARLRSRSGEA